MEKIIFTLLQPFFQKFRTFYVNMIYVYNVDKKVPKSSADFFCKNCNYTTSRKSQYDRHLMTAKHKMLTNVDKKVPKSSAPFQCDCGNNSHRVYRHIKKWNEQSNEKNIFKDDYTNENIMMELINKMKNLKVF